VSLTLSESLAMAVLKGDTVAAYALADLLLEQRARGDAPLDEGYTAIRDGPRANDGYHVYAWPEFKAFCKRAGIMYDLLTISMVITIQEGGRLEVDQKYAALDRGEQ
jgi:hypothetical protein